MHTEGRMSKSKSKKFRPVTDATKAVAYIRVSTEEQHLGPEAQLAAIELWASRQGVTVVAVHRDLGVSGATPLADCKGLMAALEDIKVHGAGLLVVAKRDRLARDVMKSAMAEARAEALGPPPRLRDGGEGPLAAHDPRVGPGRHRRTLPLHQAERRRTRPPLE
jgi:predicted site-specific integrase-resolvase